MHVKELKLVFSQGQIQDRVTAMGAAIDQCYGDAPLVVVCVLKGASIFFSDLVRAITTPRVELDFVRLCSYGTGDNSSGSITFRKDVEISLTGKHVLIVEDIVDTGHTMHFLRGEFAARGAASLRIAALVDKHERREKAVQTDFAGFSLPKGFIVGYGLDYAEQYRNLPAIYEVIPE
ncbi:MAG: hypoxanthine phosphoribosyltransferase [Desulfovibrionaceae bacterium]